MIHDVIIVGAGAAGLYAGALIPGRHNLILEGTKTPGTKLLMAGGGQCNLTHDGSIKAFVTRYGANGKAIRALLYHHSNTALIRFWEAHGLQLTTREDGKMFPASFSARDVRDRLLAACRQNGFTLHCHQKVEQAERQPDGLWRLCAVHPQTKKKTEYITRHVILACGGRSYPSTGSDGSILPVLESLDVPLVPLRPALSPIYVSDYPYEALAGVSVPDVRMSVFPGQNLQTDDLAFLLRARPAALVTGDLLFTHDCFSGPAALHAARYLQSGHYISINYLPGQDMSGLISLLLETTHGSGSKRQTDSLLYDCFGDRLPRRLIDHVLVRQNLQKNTPCSQLTKGQLKGILHVLTFDIYRAKSGGFSGAMATAGGVSLHAADLKTCCLTKHPGLYVVGELLDIDGDTGGYNLQFAFSSAAAAASAVCDSLQLSEDYFGL